MEVEVEVEDAKMQVTRLARAIHSAVVSIVSNPFL